MWKLNSITGKKKKTFLYSSPYRPLYFTFWFMNFIYFLITFSNISFDFRIYWVPHSTPRTTSNHHAWPKSIHSFRFTRYIFYNIRWMQFRNVFPEYTLIFTNTRNISQKVKSFSAQYTHFICLNYLCYICVFIQPEIKVRFMGKQHFII